MLCSGLTTAKEQPYFRAANMITVKNFDHTRKPTAKLPSDADPGHVYGMPSSHRTHDLVRTCGPAEPAVKHLIQGAFQDEWIQTNLAKPSQGQGNCVAWCTGCAPSWHHHQDVTYRLLQLCTLQAYMCRRYPPALRWATPSVPCATPSRTTRVKSGR
jgi:hypothetical protein